MHYIGFALFGLISLITVVYNSPTFRGPELILGATPALTVPQGGTGQDDFQPGSILVGGSQLRLATTSTSTLSATSPLSLSGTTVILGAARSLSIDTSGAWSGTAGSLAANGSNCSAGLAAGGVTAAGAAEDCTDYWTEAENTAAAYINATQDVKFSTTSADYWKTLNNFFSTTSADYWETTQASRGFSTTSADYWKTVRNFFSTTSADYWETQQVARTADDLTNNSIEDLNDVAAMTKNYGDLLTWNGTTWIDFATSTLGLLGSSSISATSPLTYTPATGIFAITNAGADGSTKGAASFTAADFDATSGNISIDYTNGQAASGSAKGFLTSADWTTFNNKVATSRTLTVAGTAGQITSSAGSQDLSANRTWTLSLPNHVIFPSSFQATSASTTNATTTNLHIASITGSTQCLQADTNGRVSGTGAACGSGGGSISGWATTTAYGSQLLLYPTLGTEDVVFGKTGAAATSSAPFWWDVSATSTYIGNGGTGSSTMQFGPTGKEWLMGYDGSDSSFKISSSTVATGFSVSNVLSIAKATLLTTFSNAVTVAGQLTASAGAVISSFLQIPNGAAPTVDATGEIALDTTSNQLLVATSTNAATPAVFSSRLYPSFFYATSTTWTGTTTIDLGPAYVAEEWVGVKCFTDAGTLNVSFYDGTNRMTLLNASTTVGAFKFSTNATFTAGEKRYVDIGTPATSPKRISCTTEKFITRD